MECRQLSFLLFGLILCASVHVLGVDASGSCTILRATPDTQTTVFTNGTLTINFNQPIQSGKSGNVTIYSVTPTATTELYSISMHTPYVYSWEEFSNAMIVINPFYPNGTSVFFAPSGSQFMVTLDQGAWVASDGGAPCDGFDEGEWTFTVNSEGPPQYLSYVPPQPEQQAIVNKLISMMNATNVNNTVAHISLDYYNRFFQSPTGVAAASSMLQQYMALVEVALDNGLYANVQTFEHAWNMPSLIVSLAPAGPPPSEVVIIGAHLDSINRQNWTTNVKTGRAPGADDDGSGIGLELEMFRVLVESGFTPTRKIEIHVYSGEEEGLFGSADIAAEYARNNISVASMLMLDQCAYLRNPDNETIAVYSDNTDEQLSDLLRSLITEYTDVQYVDSNEDNRADSDFHSWHNQGYRAAYIAEGPIDDIVFGNNKHSPYDRIEDPHFSLDHAMNVGKAAFAYVIEMAMDVSPNASSTRHHISV
eukprot:TRINITY_DN16831_c0_g1_i1.p1 TRINITY_DN16831_c0_g1~~TRINITY_DN16831_c0_g1_i1.p1  ORF type:complete len:505 (+),score=110.38 TRINITY_DN16831_c0_g1_i1:83-1516(+)